MNIENGLSSKDRKILKEDFKPKVINGITIALKLISSGLHNQNGLGEPVSEFFSDYFIASGVIIINEKINLAKEWDILIPENLIPEEIVNLIQEETPWAEEFINRQAELIGFLGIEKYASEFAVYSSTPGVDLY
ncbi:MAG: hypothetical protein Q7R43_02145 [Candidatus Daviesbacteria bacterium]|nr:hypothetical protein [Candidatus Daviesbacteria bacterium]